ncbi:(2Fe-2S) ferredoxin domain-containing protein [Lyngbya sp. CCY1209]|jgi:(2Fe-2S) ferredoxin|uniref:(2Fe-2S) ferredoxin domain-containing protein n=1 Tax=Lyngbya sp. CCY1209 TaxID=2886103 RepID=UPI002D2106B0|nr:(2Fe-2S) ferredoxin domain-containing protein [Lyngbya sp. CCY1209]MEB3884239.1 (2Fe-2S) ferredoxin domain-containing protein [Lyngbya sp. CCY1209]
MTTSCTPQTSSIQLEATFIDLLRKSNGKPKAIIVNAGEQNFQIKLSKELRKTWNFDLHFGDSIHVCGEQKIKSKKIKVKAHQICPLACSLERPETPPTVCSKSRPGKIMLCQKSGCLKRGGKQLNAALQTAIANLGLEEQIEIVPTRCQKRCKNAPNMVMMPSKAKYGKISPEDITALLKEHYLI